MIELVFLALLVAGGLAALALFATVVGILKLVLWVVLLPLRLVFWLLLLPLLLLKFVFGALLAVLVAPLLALVLIVGIAAALLAVAVPLLPVFALAAIVYVLVRAASPAYS
jgi:hypothetical protein